MNKIFYLATLFLLTLILVIDYFPVLTEFDYNNSVLITIFVILILLSLIFNRNSDKKEHLKETLIWQLIATAYIVFLVVALTIIGGTSDTAISLDSWIFWLAIIISLIDAYRTYKKLKQLESREINYS